MGSEEMTERLARQLEAVLFLSPEPLGVKDLCGLAEVAPGPVQRALQELGQRYSEDSGLELAEVAGGFTFRTRGDVAEICDRLRHRPPEDRLSPASLETLAVIAYMEPIGRPEISRIRGVQADGVVTALVERGLLEEVGRDEPGGPIMFRTTRAFQERFNIKGAGELPAIERFELTGPEAEAIRARLMEAGHVRDDGGDDD